MSSRLARPDDQPTREHRRNFSTGSSTSAASAARPNLANLAHVAAARSAVKDEQHQSRRGSITKSSPNSGSSPDLSNVRKSSFSSAAAMSQEDAWKDGQREHYAQYPGGSDDALSRQQRAFRTRAASNPNPLNIAENSGSSSDYPPGLGPSQPDHPGSSTSGNGAWNSPGMAWGSSQPSIWKGGNGAASASAGSTPAESNKSTYFAPDIVVTTAAFPSRQHRSFSFSLGSMRGLQSYEEEDSGFDRDRITTLPLRGGDDHSENGAYEAQANIPKMRSRSKSSSEIYGLMSGQEARYTYPEAPVSPDSPSAEYGDVNSIWAATQGTAAGRAHDAATAMMHRRPSAQADVYWDSSRASGGGGGRSANDPTIAGPTAEQIERYRQQRRFSHAPGLHNDYAQQMISRPRGDAPDVSPYDIARRRHSLAGPLYGSASPDFLAAGMDALRLDETSDTPFLDEIDDYFENTKRRTKAWVEAGKNLQAQSYPHQWPLYVVEFKAGRTDFFHVADLAGAPIMKGDLVIVEADRGKDLGKVIADDIASLQQLQVYQAQHADTLVDSHSANKEVHPKRIYRSAAPAEVTMLVAKSQDEAKAMALCQTKIRQKKLPMEIVDAEYQWDRRKLTFYFVADRRIDFRELVRELFKIYKTRIWMYDFAGRKRA
ncbi:hypothetical protein HDU86_002061 [Geranomyces michiganensis]|nr:hypothetical protein HDU86_002061 [Geranomyces michiganensis]